jgi:hypothetical protein
MLLLISHPVGGAAEGGLASRPAITAAIPSAAASTVLAAPLSDSLSDFTAIADASARQPDLDVL